MGEVGLSCSDRLSQKSGLKDCSEITSILLQDLTEDS